jgi:glutamine synthetase
VVLKVYEKICEAFRPVTAEHVHFISAYNDLRLNRKTTETCFYHLTSHMAFLMGLLYSVFVMTSQGWKGWLEIEDLHQMEVLIKLLLEL